MTEYQTIASLSTISYTEKKSEFIAQLCPVQTQQEALDFIESIRKQHRKARHNVYAYQLRENHISRYSDDGEPQGTAGFPILDVLQKRSLIDVCCVVTRYFGGILLGANGLVRAYSHSASLAIEQAQLQIMCPCYPVSLQMDYNQYGKISYHMSKSDVIILNTTFNETVKMQLYVKESALPSMQATWVELTGNQIQCNVGTLQYADFSSIEKP